jgi:aspartate/methionine/tyrosine aminotransferase
MTVATDSFLDGRSIQEDTPGRQMSGEHERKQQGHGSAPELSHRVRNTVPAYIDEVVAKYASDPECQTKGFKNLAMGVARWGPPESAVRYLQGDGTQGAMCYRYNDVLGVTALREALVRKLQLSNGLNMNGQEVMVCGGANQAFFNVAMALLDDGDVALLPKPYYFSHLAAMQLAGARVEHCGWEPDTMLPDMVELSTRLRQGDVKLLVLTTPANPSGAVCPRERLEAIIDICREMRTWILVDEAYEDVLHDGVEHVSPCAHALNYQGIIHCFTMSKSYGMAGWRVAYLVYPSHISSYMQRINDAIPTHASVAGQMVALAALEAGPSWASEQASRLQVSRDALWEAVSDTGAVKTSGAWYFLVPLPPGCSEEVCVDELVRTHGVLVMPGSAFGAPHFARVSYGSLSDEDCWQASRNLREGLNRLKNLDFSMTS